MENVYVTKSLCMNQKHLGGVVGIKGELIGRRFDLRDNTDVFFGRDSSEVDVAVHGAKVSRIHLSIRFNRKTNDYTVQDCSSNGTYIGPDKFLLHKDKRRVSAGTILLIGDEENVLQLL